MADEGWEVVADEGRDGAVEEGPVAYADELRDVTAVDDSPDLEAVERQEEPMVAAAEIGREYVSCFSTAQVCDAEMGREMRAGRDAETGRTAGAETGREVAAGR